MTSFSLYDRITQSGTLSEPTGVSDPSFALASTINWMRALALLVEHNGLTFKTSKAFYASTTQQSCSIQTENSILEQLLFAVHQLSALEAFASIPHKADVARVGSVAWYYGVYAAARAMIAAQDGSFKEDHASVATAWDRQLASRNLVMSPFHFRISTLIKENIEVELATLRASHSNFPLTASPKNASEAYGACITYLAGNATWWRERAEKNLKSSSEFKKLGLTNFRTKQARELRDKHLSKRSIAFLHEAFRYRGKANYREALF